MRVLISKISIRQLLSPRTRATKSHEVSRKHVCVASRVFGPDKDHNRLLHDDHTTVTMR